jgi:hypothetical protein
LVALAVWMALVTVPPLFVARMSFAALPTGERIALGSTAVIAGKQVLRLEAGSHVPLRVDLESTILNAPPRSALDLTLTLPVEVALHDGKPDGRYRIADGPWRSIRDGVLQLMIDRISPRLEQGAPVLRAHARFGGRQFEGDKQ